jgi:hypothetical protein
MREKKEIHFCGIDSLLVLWIDYELWNSSILDSHFAFVSGY